MEGVIISELRKVVVTGNSLTITLPRKYLKVLRVGPSDYLELFLADANTLVLRKYKTTERKKYND